MTDSNALGILGLGSRSTLWYLSQLNAGYQAHFGGYSTCPFLLLNTDFNSINPFLPDQFEMLESAILPFAERFDRAGVTHVLVPNITLHRTLDRMSTQFDFDLIHPLEQARAHLDTEKPVMLLGTAQSMRSSYFQEYWWGQKLVSPGSDEIEFVDQVRKEVYAQEPSPETVRAFVHQLVRWTADYQVVLACTELSLIQSEIRVEGVLDLAQLQIVRALQVSGVD